MPARKSKKQLKVIILTANEFEDMELFFPLFRLMEEGASVDVAAPDRQQIQGERGYSLKPTLTFDEVKPDNYDLLIIPGGSPDGAPNTVRNNARAIAITKAFFAKDKPVASICHGPWTLAAADVIKGRKLTGFWHDGVPEAIREAGGLYEDASVVVDKNLVTSRWPMDLPDFMREVMRMVRRINAETRV